MVNLAEKLNPESGRLLESLSWAKDDNDLDTVDVSRDDLHKVLELLGRISDFIARSDLSIVPTSEDFADRYENSEHVRMLDAVGSVFREALRLTQPFRAWRE